MKYTPIQMFIIYSINWALPVVMNEYVYSLVFLFVIYYLLSFLNFALLLLNFNLRSVVFLSSLHTLTSLKSVRLLTLVVVLSLAGVPPVPMFFIKISILTTIFAKNALTVLALIFFLTVVSMVFYLQLIRFLVSKTTKPALVYEKNTALFLRPIIVMLVIVTLLNISLVSTILDVSTFLDLLLIS